MTDRFHSSKTKSARRLEASSGSNATQRPLAASTDDSLGSAALTVASRRWMADSKSDAAIASASLMLAFRIIWSRRSSPAISRPVAPQTLVGPGEATEGGALLEL